MRRPYANEAYAASAFPFQEVAVELGFLAGFERVLGFPRA
jgi:hypothetical protein